MKETTDGGGRRRRFDDLILGRVNLVFGLGKKLIDGVSVVENAVELLDGLTSVMKKMKDLDGHDGDEQGEGGNNHDK